jgi:transposase-like protein
MRCPHCEKEDSLIKDGKNRSGSQRYQCKACGRRYTPEPNKKGYPEEVRLQALRLYVDGKNLRRIARHLGVSPQSVSNWVNAYVAQLPNAPSPEQVETVELDELFTFIGEKKTRSTS